MACGCIPVIVDPGPKCNSCLIVPDLRYRCDKGPDPCGDTLVVDLTEYHNLDACGSEGYEYTLLSYDDSGLTNVSLTAQGILSIETLAVYNGHVEYPVQYRVSCSNEDSILSAIGIVYVCMNNPCGYCPPGLICNICTKECENT